MFKDQPRVEYLIVDMSRKWQYCNLDFCKWFDLKFASFVEFVKFSLNVPAVTDIDTSGIHALEELHNSLKKRDVQVTKLN